MTFPGSHSWPGAEAGLPSPTVLPGCLSPQHLPPRDLICLTLSSRAASREGARTGWPETLPALMETRRASLMLRAAWDVDFLSSQCQEVWTEDPRGTLGWTHFRNSPQPTVWSGPCQRMGLGFADSKCARSGQLPKLWPRDRLDTCLQRPGTAFRDKSRPHLP